jgi:hypothetical protein
MENCSLYTTGTAANGIGAFSSCTIGFNFSSMNCNQYGIFASVTVPFSANIHVFYSTILANKGAISADGTVHVHHSNLTTNGTGTTDGGILTTGSNLTLTNSNVTSARNTVKGAGDNVLIWISNCNLTSTGGQALTLTSITNSMIHINHTIINGSTYGIRFVTGVNNTSLDILNNSLVISPAICALMMVVPSNNGWLNISNSDLQGGTAGLTNYWTTIMSNVNITTNSGSAYTSKVNFILNNCNFTSGTAKGIDITTGDSGYMTFNNCIISSGSQAITFTGITNSVIRIDHTIINGSTYGIRFVTSVNMTSLDIENGTQIRSDGIAALLYASATGNGWLNITDLDLDGVTGGLTSYWRINISNSSLDTVTGDALKMNGLNTENQIIRDLYLNASITALESSGTGGSFNVTRCHMIGRILGADYTVGFVDNSSFSAYYANGHNSVNFRDCTIGPDNTTFEGVAFVNVSRCNIFTSSVTQWYFYGSCNFWMDNSSFNGSLVEASTANPVWTYINDTIFNGTMNIGSDQNLSLRNVTYNNTGNLNLCIVFDHVQSVFQDCNMEFQDGTLQATLIPDLTILNSIVMGNIQVQMGKVNISGSSLCCENAAFDLSGNISITNTTIYSDHDLGKISNISRATITNCSILTGNTSSSGFTFEGLTDATLYSCNMNKLTCNGATVHIYDGTMPEVQVFAGTVHDYRDIVVNWIPGQFVQVWNQYGQFVANGTTDIAGKVNLYPVPWHVFTASTTYLVNSTFQIPIPGAGTLTIIDLNSSLEMPFLESTVISWSGPADHYQIYFYAPFVDHSDSLELSFGLNAVCWPGDEFGTYTHAANLLQNPNVFYVAMWNKDLARWDICRDELTNNFVLTRGMGLWISVRAAGGLVLSFHDGISPVVNYGITFGQNFAGNPTNGTIQASAITANSTDIFYIAAWAGSSYQLYRPGESGSSSFLVQPGQAFWISTREELDTIQYKV